MNAAQNPLNNCPYWVGDILTTMSEIQPAQRWPGTTWVQITDCMLRAADSTHPAGSTGGEKEHALTTNEGPRHSHRLGIRVNKNSGDSGVAHTSIETSTGWYDMVYTDKNTLIDCESSGNSQPHNNMQPYIATYRYRRIA